MIVILGDFNAKTGLGHKVFPENMGKYGKINMNSNGRHLHELFKKQDLSH